jgi:hypothetical protein
MTSGIFHGRHSQIQSQYLFHILFKAHIPTKEEHLADDGIKKRKQCSAKEKFLGVQK